MRKVPARVGGVDLSQIFRQLLRHIVVPARVGGVDLSDMVVLDESSSFSPRPCGRGGFKPSSVWQPIIWLESPPVWAGWI